MGISMLKTESKSTASHRWYKYQIISLPKISHQMATTRVGIHQTYVGTNEYQWLFFSSVWLWSQICWGRNMRNTLLHASKNIIQYQWIVLKGYFHSNELAK